MPAAERCGDNGGAGQLVGPRRGGADSPFPPAALAKFHAPEIVFGPGNVSCAHCLSSSGRRDPDELTTSEMRSVIDQLQFMQVFYVNVGGGEPTVRPDFWELLDYAVASQIGVKFSTNGLRLDAERAQRLAATEYVDVQISLDGASRQVNDAVRGPGSYDMALGAMENLAAAGVRDLKAGTVRASGGFAEVWRSAPLFARLRTETSGGPCRSCSAYSSCQGGCKLCDSSPLAVTP